MSLHDHGVVLFRFGHSRNDLSRNTGVPNLVVKGGLWFVTKDEILSIFVGCISYIFFLPTSRDEHRTISGNVLSNLSPHISNQT